MPHVIVKLWPGKSATQKARLAEAITRDIQNTLGYGADSVSVSFEEIAAKDWASQVFEPDITAHPERLVKKPGYSM
jgi:4-oxalocrotonate tautomerase